MDCPRCGSKPGSMWVPDVGVTIYPWENRCCALKRTFRGCSHFSCTKLSKCKNQKEPKPESDCPKCGAKPGEKVKSVYVPPLPGENQCCALRRVFKNDPKTESEVTKSSAYDEFVKTKLSELATTNPEMSMEKRMKIVAEEWSKKRKEPRTYFVQPEILKPKPYK